nr:enoyl-CoA hydratase/isomerase family protein [Sphingomonas sp. CDS-1]
MDYHFISYDVEDRIVTVTLNRPEAMNALTDELYRELRDALERIRSDKDIACVILSGAGRAFCAGADLKVPRDHMTAIDRRTRHRWILKEVLEPLHRLEKPVIAAVNGAAVGAGCNLALACDFIVASKKASFHQSFTKLGLVPDLGGLYFLVRAVGPNMAKELCLTGRKVDAEEAGRIGLANRVVPHEGVLPVARQIALEIANASPTANAMAKTLLNMSSSSSLEQMLEYEGYAQTMAFMSPDYKEGVEAFRERRAPNFFDSLEKT